jgi:hypothetical protein
MGLFEWGEKRFARGIARAMIRGYKLFKADQSNLSEWELIKLTLSTRPGKPAQQILKDMNDSNFWERVVGKNFVEVIYILIRVEYIESMKGTLETESEKTNAVFKKVLKEEIKKVGL